MKEFPSTLKPSNKEQFAVLNRQRVKNYMRRDIYEFVISHTEEDYFDLDCFNQRVNNIIMVKEVCKELITELETLGWKCKLSYGDTGLFVYSTEKPPSRCWDGTF